LLLRNAQSDHLFLSLGSRFPPLHATEVYPYCDNNTNPPKPLDVWL
jgi:hypothetical protein